MAWEATMSLRQVETGFHTSRTFTRMIDENNPSLGVISGHETQPIYRLQQLWVWKEHEDLIECGNKYNTTRRWVDVPTAKEEER